MANQMAVASEDARMRAWREELAAKSEADPHALGPLRERLRAGPVTPRALEMAMREQGLECPPLELILGEVAGIGVDQRGRLTVNENHAADSSPVPSEGLGILSGAGLWGPLPPWARFLIDVGTNAAQLKGPWSWVISLPTRAYAAILIAAGIVIATAHQARTSYPEPWFRQLSGLPEGVTVTIRDGEKLTKAVFRGVERIEETHYLVLEEKSGTRKMPASQSLRVTPTRAGAASLSGALRLGDRLFLRGVLTNVDPLDFMRTSKLHCLICGGVNEVRVESMDPAFATKTSTGVERGRIQSVIRIARIVGRKGHFRTEVVAAGDRHEEAQLGRPSLVIHNGADAYVRRRRLEEVPQIVLIGRADRQVEAALSLVNSEYSQRRGDLDPPPPRPTPGIDQVVFVGSER